MPFLLFSLYSAIGQPAPAVPPAAPTPAPPQDPLMSLMMTQPQIDVTSPVVATVAVDPPVVRPGEEATYRVSFNALEASIEWPGKVEAPPGLDLRPGAQGQIFALTGTNMQPRTGFNYRVSAAQTGHYTIPEYKVTVYGKPVIVPAVQLEVTTSPPASVPQPQQLFLKLLDTNLVSRHLYVGQSVKAQILLPAGPGNVLQGLAQVQLSGQGFIVDQAPMPQPIQPMPLGPGGSRVATVLYEVSFTPITAGKFSVFAQGYTVSNPFLAGGQIIIRGPAVIQPGPPKYTLIDSDPLELNVWPLPRSSRLPGFTGAVGSYSVEPPVLSTNRLRVGDTLKLTVQVRGENNGNVARLVAPPPPKVRDWQVFAAPADNLPPQIIQLQKSVAFNYTLIPLTDEARSTPPIPFSCFDPQRDTYVDLTIPPVPVSVQPAGTPTDLQALVKAEQASPGAEKEPVLSGLAAAPGLRAGSLVPLQQRSWFILVQVAPGVAFLWLWLWDRRRRYLEQHPEVVLRRRARRALRRERRALRHAARSGDASAYAMAGINAMRVACAPHYPAEARALVGHDVLLLLPETERNSRDGEVVRRFFAVSDAARFASTAEDTTQLLPLQADLERVLERLEERL